jgi:uncharacterized protein with GYD domain
MAKEKDKADVTDEVTYFFLVKHTDQGAVQTVAHKKKGVSDVTEEVRKENGKCRLYSTRGSVYDYLSVITGINTAAAIRILGEIEKRGTVKATILPGVEIFYEPSQPQRKKNE